MGSKPYLYLLTAALGILGVMVGCSQQPMAPSRAVALSVTMAPHDNVKASLLGVVQNEIYYRVDGAGEGNPHSVYGPFSMPVSDGSVSFTVRVPQGQGTQLLSLQLNDASTHQPLAIGATTFNFGAGLEGGLVVDMGSVTRTCYYTYENLSPGVTNLYYNGSSYAFVNDLLQPGFPVGAPFDISLAPLGAGGFYMQTYTGSTLVNTIAYLGNGDFVDFDRVPPASQFYQYSYQGKAAAGAGVTLLQADDIYCVRADNTYKKAGVYAWVQITDPGTVGSTGPSFRFRLNSTLPYFAYEQTAPDLANSCGITY